MPSLKKTKHSEEFNVSRKELREEGDKNFCSPIAISALTGIPVKEVNQYMLDKGYRKVGRGVYRRHTIAVMREFGFDLEIIPRSDFIEQYPKAHRVLKNITTHHPRRFNKVWKNGKKYLLFSEGHVSAVVDGELLDWAVNNSLRVNTIYEVKPVGDDNENKK